MPDYIITAHEVRIVDYYVTADSVQQAKDLLEKNPANYESDIVDDSYIESFGPVKENK